jgi:hypothetical protein
LRAEDAVIRRVKVRRIVAAEYLSLDGVTEDPGPMGAFEHRGWTLPYWNDELAKYQSDQLFASDALLLGRVIYEEFVASWPLRSGDPFSDRMNSLPKFVASTTLEEPLEWNATLLKGDVARQIRETAVWRNPVARAIDRVDQWPVCSMVSSTIRTARSRSSGG